MHVELPYENIAGVNVVIDENKTPVKFCKIFGKRRIGPTNIEITGSNHHPSSSSPFYTSDIATF